MFRVTAGKTGRYCDGLTRRSFLQLGVAGMASVGETSPVNLVHHTPQGSTHPRPRWFVDLFGAAYSAELARHAAAEMPIQKFFIVPLH